MTHHSETTGPFDSNDISAQEPPTGPAEHTTQVTLRTPAELADALPYLLGYRPEDSMVLVALHDHAGRGRFGGRARLGIPANDEDWEAAARQLARGLVTGSERRGGRPERMVAYVCQEPGPGESGRDVKHRLGRLAHLMRIECGNLDVPVIEALCISDGRFWSYCCPVEDCCPEDGSPMGLPGTSVLAAAATYAGLQVRGTLKDLRARLQPWETSAALEQEIALDAVGMHLVPRMLDETARLEVAQETIALAELIISRYATAAPACGARPADVRDDGLLGDDEAAALILGLQDRTTRDKAAAWMEGDEAGPALRLWRALARRCVGPYGEHAAAPLTLAGWVAWSTGDELEAREALAMALAADPDYLFARLLHQACNDGLDPEAVRRCLRVDRAERPTTQPASKTAPAPETVLAEPSQTPPLTSATDRQDSGPRVEPGSRKATQRRRRVLSDEEGGRPTARTKRDRRRPAHPRPRTAPTDTTGPGTCGPAATRTRAAAPGDATPDCPPSDSGQPGGDG